MQRRVGRDERRAHQQQCFEPVCGTDTCAQLCRNRRRGCRDVPEHRRCELRRRLSLGNGWIAFAATHTGSDRTADEPVLVRQQALPRKVHLVTSAGRTRVRFQPSGGNAGSNVTFTFCDGRGRCRRARMRWRTAVPSIPRRPSPRTSRRPAQVHSRRGCVHGSSGRTECVLRSQPPRYCVHADLADIEKMQR